MDWEVKIDMAGEAKNDLFGHMRKEGYWGPIGQ